MSVNQQSTINFLVPAYGMTNAVTVTLPGDGNVETGPGSLNYGIDFRSLSQVLQGNLFIPQAATVDCTNLASGTFVTFSIPAINFNYKIYAGQQKTFQFPALADLLITLIPSSGTPAIPTFWYNYPALPDGASDSVQIVGPVTISSLPAITIGGVPSGPGTDASANAPALLAHKIATIAPNGTRIGFIVQNQDTNPMQVVLTTSGGGDTTVIVLNPAGAAGQAGGSLDFTGIPHNGQIDVYSASAGAIVTARAW